jgi:hypothetical protein
LFSSFDLTERNGWYIRQPQFSVGWQNNDGCGADCGHTTFCKFLARKYEILPDNSTR